MKIRMAAMAAMTAIIGFTACNREAARDGEAAAKEAPEAGSEAVRDVGAGAAGAGDATAREARQTGNDIREGGGQITDKAAAEARQTTRDVKEGAGAAADKIQEEARQTGRDMKEVMAGDEGKTESDKQIITRIRGAVHADKDMSGEARDVRIIAKEGKVTLEGTVTSTEAKAGIARISREIAGATKVEDEVKVSVRVGSGASER